MSFGGILASALAGGAGAIGKQAGDDIEQGRKTELMKQEADIREQTEKRLTEFRAGVDRTSAQNKLIDMRNFNASDESIAAADKLAMGAGKTARKVELEKLNDNPLNDAARYKVAADAKAAADSAASILKIQAADPELVQAIGVMELAKPQVRAQIAASNAASGASAQSVRESVERLRQLGEVGVVATQVRGLQSKLAGAKTEEERAGFQQQITDLGFSGKDIKGFMAIAEKAITNGDAAMKILLDPTADQATKDLAKTQLQRANEFAEQAAKQAGIKLNPSKAAGGAPAVGTVVGGFEFKGGDPNDKKNWTPKAAPPAPGKGIIPVPELDMAEITFAGDGYKFNGQTWPTLAQARQARDADKAKANRSPMSTSLSQHGD